jgi:hypothetical protein
METPGFNSVSSKQSSIFSLGGSKRGSTQSKRKFLIGDRNNKIHFSPSSLSNRSKNMKLIGKFVLNLVGDKTNSIKSFLSSKKSSSSLGEDL